MNLKLTTALLTLLMLGNSLTAMELTSESSDDEFSETLSDDVTTENESFWSAQVTGARSLLSFGASACSHAYDAAKNYYNYKTLNKQLYEACKNPDPERLRELLNHPTADLHFVGNLLPLWLEIRELCGDTRDAAKANRAKECRTIIREHEAQLKITGKLSLFDEFLRAIADVDRTKISALLNLPFDINGRDCNGWTVLQVTNLLNFSSCIPRLCERADFDPNVPFVLKREYSKPRDTPTCALLELMRTRKFNKELCDWAQDSTSEQHPQSLLLVLEMRSLVEKGATISAEIAKKIRRADSQSVLGAFGGSLGIMSKINDNARLCGALGLNLHQTGLGIMQRLAFKDFQKVTTRSEENSAVCMLWAIYCDEYIDLNERAGTFLFTLSFPTLPIDIAYGKAPFEFSLFAGTVYVDHQGLSFKEFAKAQMRTDWALEPQTVNAQDDLGMTPLMWAAARGNLELTQFLVEFPALDPTRVDRFFGFTALHFAVRNGHTEMVRLVIQLPGSHRTQKTASGRTPYQLAQNCKQTEVIKFLDDRNKRRLHLLKCLLVKTPFPLDIRKKIVSELRF